MMAGTLSLALLIMVALATTLLLVGVTLSALQGQRALARIAVLENLLGDSLDASDELAETLGEELDGLRSGAREQLRRTERLGRQVEQIAVDIVRRDACRDDTPAQRGSLIAAARGGQGVETLVREHGLSADEAELLVLLHGDAAAGAEQVVR